MNKKNILPTKGKSMIQSHFAAIEETILQLAKIQDNAGHSIHKGTPREIFIKNFLENHLGKTVSFGTGEIFDSDSRPGEPRNQHDIVIYRNEFPRLDFQGGITAFLAESVIATIEVKSDLKDKDKDLKPAFASAIVCKNLKRNYFEGDKRWHSPPKILNYIVAFNGPKKLQTVYSWIKKLENEFNFEYPEMPPNQQERIKVPSPGIDGIFILGKGFIHFDNFMIDCVKPEIRQENQWMRWVFVEFDEFDEFVNSEVASLLLLFLNLAQAICSFPQKAVQLIPYLKEMSGRLQWGN